MGCTQSTAHGEEANSAGVGSSGAQTRSGRIDRVLREERAALRFAFRALQVGERADLDLDEGVGMKSRCCYLVLVSSALTASFAWIRRRGVNY